MMPDKTTILTHNNNDRGHRFAKLSWHDGLYFIWDSPKQAYRYMNGSMVGINVLNADNLIKLKTKRKQKEDKMKTNVNYIGTNYEVVEVTYDMEEPYLNSYFFKTSIKLSEGSLVVVEDSKGLSLCRVVSDSIPASIETETIRMFNKAKAWVVDIVNTQTHDKRREATERKKFILSQLAERKEAMEETAIYEMLAQTDEVAAKLIGELKGIQNDA